METLTKCDTCQYYGFLDKHNRCCHYLLDTGELRGCSVENCDKYIERYENRGDRMNYSGGHRK